jgi:carboxymethylenebutenolidase
MKTLSLAPLALAFLLALWPASAQDWAKQRLEDSPRHLEWITIKEGDRELTCFIAFPEVQEAATTVVVIHEIFGLTDWVRGVADQLAEAGFIAVAPDLLSGAGPGGGGTAAFESGDAVRKAIASLSPAQITADLKATVDYLAQLPAGNGKVTVAGFCWGGAQTFRFANQNSTIKAAFVFYGSGPDQENGVSKIQSPVYGFYGDNDARVNATVPKTLALMKSAGKTFEPVFYDQAGHGFMRAGEAPDGSEPNRKARSDAWERWKELLENI